MGVNWQIVLTKQAQKDLKSLNKIGLRDKVLILLKQLEKDPFQQPFEKLVGDLKGKYSRRINIQHRLVYSVDKTAKIIKILKAYEHY